MSFMGWLSEIFRGIVRGGAEAAIEEAKKPDTLEDAETPPEMKEEFDEKVAEKLDPNRKP